MIVNLQPAILEVSWGLQAEGHVGVPGAQAKVERGAVGPVGGG